MPRINLDDDFFEDPRVLVLAQKIGHDAAIGKCIRAFRLAQTHWRKDRQLIPETKWAYSDLDELVEVGLAEPIDDQIYVKGSKEHFKWLDDKAKYGRLGGKKSAQAKRSKRKQTQAEAKQTQADAKQIQPSNSNSNSNNYIPSVCVKTHPLVDLWNRLKSEAQPRVAKINPARMQKIKARMKDCPDLEQWEQVIKKIAESDWCNGRTDRSDWIAGFDFLLKPDTFHKALEGAYDNRTSKPQQDWVDDYEWVGSKPDPRGVG